MLQSVPCSVKERLRLAHLFNRKVDAIAGPDVSFYFLFSQDATKKREIAEVREKAYELYGLPQLRRERNLQKTKRAGHSS
jgi:hypothetical protein